MDGDGSSLIGSCIGKLHVVGCIQRADWWSRDTGTARCPYFMEATGRACIGRLRSFVKQVFAQPPATSLYCVMAFYVSL